MIGRREGTSCERRVRRMQRANCSPRPINGNASMTAPDSCEDVARLIAAAFDAYRSRFTDITRRATLRFARREWALGRADAAERLALGRGAVAAPVAVVREWPPPAPPR